MVYSDQRELEGGPILKNHDAHFIPVAPRNPLNPNSGYFDACKPDQKHVYTELVVEDSAACLPRYLVKLQPVSPEIAFGKSKWEQYYGAVGEEPALPFNINQILEEPCPIWPQKKIKETHLLVLIPKTINGKPLTLQLLRELVKKPKDSGGGQQLLKKYPSYEKPSLLEASIAIFTECVATGTHWYSDTYTRCAGRVNGVSLFVGGFVNRTLHIKKVHHPQQGLAACRKFHTFRNSILAINQPSSSTSSSKKNEDLSSNV